jgi:hypothetical protein
MLDFDPAQYAAFLVASLPGLAAAPLAQGRLGCLDAALDAAPRQGIGIELGVYKGISLRRAARRQPWRHFHGFDSLKGFPADGRPDWKLDFTVAAPPKLPPNCSFHAGFFEATLPRFVANVSEPVAILNVDCDIHSSAHEGFTTLSSRLGPGVALHLDEAVNYDTWLFNEMLARFRFLDALELDINWIARGGRLRDLERTLCFLEAGRYPTWEDDVDAGYARQAAGLLEARSAPWPAAPAEMGRRLEARAQAHQAQSQLRKACHPDDPQRPPPKPALHRRIRRFIKRPYLPRIIGH